MKKSTLIAIAAALSAIALELTGEEAAAEENGSETPASPNKRGPGRPRGGGSSEPEKPKTKTFEELRAICKPLMEGGQGAEVKKLVEKYSPTGLKDLKPEDQVDFLRDIEALML